VRVREFVEALQFGIDVVREDQAGQLGHLDRVIRALLSSFGQPTSVSGALFSVCQMPSMAAILAGWCCSVFRPCMSPARSAADRDGSRHTAARSAGACRRCRLAQQLPRGQAGDQERCGERGGEQLVREPVGKRGIEDHLDQLVAWNLPSMIS
jgi:hypothetical protein